MPNDLHNDLRRKLLGRVSGTLLAELLDAVGDCQALLDAGLSLALCVHQAPRGLAFDLGRALAVVGFTTEEVETLRQERLTGLLATGGVCHYGLPAFAAPAADGDPAFGVAGVIPTSGGNFVLAVERDLELNPTECGLMAELLRLLENPLELTVRSARSERPERCERPRRPALRTLTLTDVLLARLERFPQLREMERLLIQAAIVRGRNRNEAAAALGLTRQGLHRKLLRLGLTGLLSPPSR